MIWDVDRGKPGAQLATPRNEIYESKWSSDGRFLVNTVPPEPQSMPGITLVQNWTAKLPQ